MPRPGNAVSQLLIQNLAISIKRIHGGETHCGFIFRNGSGGPLLHLHLAWSFDLRTEPLEHGYFFCLPDLDTPDQKLIAAVCSNISDSSAQIPYAFDLDGIEFNPTSCEFSVESGSIGGLTCATFVLKVMESLGFFIVDRDQWPKGINDEWANGVIERLKASGNIKIKYIKMMKADINSVRRFRPEEVAGCVSNEHWPVGFDAATIAADSVLAKI